MSKLFGYSAKNECFEQWQKKEFHVFHSIISASAFCPKSRTGRGTRIGAALWTSWWFPQVACNFWRFWQTAKDCSQNNLKVKTDLFLEQVQSAPGVCPALKPLQIVQPKCAVNMAEQFRLAVQLLTAQGHLRIWNLSPEFLPPPWCQWQPLPEECLAQSGWSLGWSLRPLCSGCSAKPRASPLRK